MLVITGLLFYVCGLSSNADDIERPEISAELAFTDESAVIPVLMMGSVLWQAKWFLARRKIKWDSVSFSFFFCLSSPESMCWPPVMICSFFFLSDIF